MPARGGLLDPFTSRHFIISDRLFFCFNRVLPEDLFPAALGSFLVVTGLFGGLGGLIGAERLLVHVVSGKGKGPCPASAADLPELAVSAPAVVVVPVPHLLEDLLGVPDCRERLFS